MDFTIFLILGLAGRVYADGGDDFASNLASDLGPIVALFGEKVVMQFMSQAMGIADCILLAVAPIGAITTVVSAIRVAGPIWLKSFIGRARETLLTAELEVMTSTSEEVCELWNGHSVVRCPGSAVIYQFICLIPNGYDAERISKKRPNIQYKILNDWQEGEFSDGKGEIKVTGPEYARLRFENAIKPIRLKVGDIYQRLFDWNASLSLRQRLWKAHTAHSNDSDPENGNFKVDSSMDTCNLTSMIQPIQSEGSDKNSSSTTVNLEDSQDIIILIDRSGNRAPNLLLNCNDRTGRSELYLAAAFGVFLQLSALVYFGFITYYQPTQHQFLKDGKLAVGYAFPCAAIGTTLLAFGLFICSWVVGESTTESHYGAKGYQLFVVWLQKHHEVNDQIFRPHAIYPTRRKYITLSRRNPDLFKNDIKDPVTGNLSLKFLTCFGSFISLVGFISQFVGMRGLNWTASVLQLGITLLVTMIRAVVRRGFGKPPASKSLKSNFELEWFALSLGDPSTAPWATFGGQPINRGEHDALQGINRGECDALQGKDPKLSIRTGDRLEYQPLQIADDHTAQLENDSIAHHVVATWISLRNLSKWKSPVSDEALRLLRAIVEVANTFLEKLPEDRYTWTLPVIYGEKSDCIYIQLKRTNMNERWTIDQERVEALLSLWLYSSHEARGSDSLRLYGSSKFTKTLKRDLTWWMPEMAPSISTLTKDEIDEKKEHGYTVVGFTSMSHGYVEMEGSYKTTRDEDELHEKYIVLECEDKQERIFSRDLLFSFMRAVIKMQEVTIADSLSVREIDYGKMTTNWKQMELRNDTISSLARKLERIGFGTLSDIYFDIIVPLSLERKLTNVKNVIIEAAKEAHKYERSCQWRRVVDICSCLLDLALQFDLEKESSGPLAIAVCFGLLIRLQHEAALQRSEGREEGELTKQLKILMDKLKSEPFEKSNNFSLPSRLLRKEWHYAMPFNTIIGPTPDMIGSLPESFQVTSDHRLFAQDSEILSKMRHIWEVEGLEKVDAFGWSPLHYAANLQPHNCRIIFSRERLDGVLNLRDFMGWTPLHYACLVGNEKIVDTLLRREALVETGGYDGITPMHCAVRGGNFKILQRLFEKATPGTQQYTGNSTVQVDCNERHPIHWAAVRGDVDSVWLLKDDIGFRDRFGWSCLHLAAIYGYKELSLLIIDGLSADVNIRDNDSRTPLHLAIQSQSKSVIPVLIEAGAQVNAKSKDGSSPLHMAVKQKDTVQLLLANHADKETTDLEGRTPLYQALAKGTIEVADLLIDEGANVSTAAKDGRTPLHMALSRGREGLDIARKLLCSDSPEAATAYANVKAKDQAAPLHIAAEYGPSEAISMLLELKANLDELDDFGQTPLLISIYNEKWDIAEMLLKAGASVNADRREGYVPLLGAVMGGNNTIVRLLLKAHVDVDVVDEDGYSPLHHAVLQNEVNILQQLLRAGADIDAVYEDRSQTALHIAVYYDRKELVKILLERGATMRIYDALGFTPFQRALYSGNLELVQDFVAHDKVANTKAVLQKGKDGNSPIHTLCQWAQYESDEETMLKMLEELFSGVADIDINAKNDEGRTPLDLAIHSAVKHRAFIDQLVERGARPGSEETSRYFEAWCDMQTEGEQSEEE